MLPTSGRVGASSKDEKEQSASPIGQLDALEPSADSQLGFNYRQYIESTRKAR